MVRAQAGLALGFALLATACGSGGSPAPRTTPAPTRPWLSTRVLPGLGRVLVNREGRTLYVFGPDHARRVTCTGLCGSIWSPLVNSGAAKPPVSGGLIPADVSTVARPGGGRVITYAGWPLYLYAVDRGAGTALGQGVSSSGGRWFVLSPSGHLITASPAPSTGAAGGGGSTSGSGNGRSQAY